jgi:hypothetical protein
MEPSKNCSKQTADWTVLSYKPRFSTTDNATASDWTVGKVDEGPQHELSSRLYPVGGCSCSLWITDSDTKWRDLIPSRAQSQFSAHTKSPMKGQYLRNRKLISSVSIMSSRSISTKLGRVPSLFPYIPASCSNTLAEIHLRSNPNANEDPAVTEAQYNKILDVPGVRGLLAPTEFRRQNGWISPENSGERHRVLDLCCGQ